MSINITQRCDGCGKSRELQLSDGVGPVQVTTAAKVGGWRSTDDLGIRSKHLCPDCIQYALSHVLPDDSGSKSKASPRQDRSLQA